MAKTQCYFLSPNGTVAVTYCPASCCSGDTQSEGDPCCEIADSFTGIYLGASIGTVVVVGLLCLCLACMCFKDKICKNGNTRSPFSVYRQSQQSNDHNGFPEIIEPKGPPAYDTLDFPPPYVLRIEEPPGYTSTTTSLTQTILARNTSHTDNPPLVTDQPPGYTITPCTSNAPVTIVVNISHPDSSRLGTD